MPKKLEHKFEPHTTVNTFREVVGQEFLDNLKGVRIYMRKVDIGCWNIKEITVEDSGVFITAGEDSNPQPNGGEVKIMEDE